LLVRGSPDNQRASSECASGAAKGVDLGDILRVLRELDDQPVGRGHVGRFAVAVIALAAVSPAASSRRFSSS
jgi:hypothetical protein